MYAYRILNKPIIYAQIIDLFESNHLRILYSIFFSPPKIMYSQMMKIVTTLFMLQDGKDRQQMKDMLSGQKDVVFEAAGISGKGVNEVSCLAIQTY